MIRDAASSSTCSGASAGGSGLPSDGSPQIQPARPCSGPHSAAAGALAPGALAPGALAPADSASFTPPVFTPSYFYVKPFDLKVSPPWANSNTRSDIGRRGLSRRRRPCGTEVSGVAAVILEYAWFQQGGIMGCDGDHIG